MSQYQYMETKINVRLATSGKSICINKMESVINLRDRSPGMKGINS